MDTKGILEQVPKNVLQIYMIMSLRNEKHNIQRVCIKEKYVGQFVLYRIKNRAQKINSVVEQYFDYK